MTWLVATVFDLNGPQHFLQWGWLRITIPNLIVITLLVIVFFIGVAGRMRDHS
jgi:hypothetical protein